MKRILCLLLTVLLTALLLMPMSVYADPDNTPPAVLADSDNEMSADESPNRGSPLRLLMAGPGETEHTLSCAGFISNEENSAYIDRMIKWYLANEPALTEALGIGRSVIMFFEGGSDHTSDPRYEEDINYRDGALGIVIRADENGDPYIVDWCEDCNTLPDFPYGFEYDNGHEGFGTAILVDGVYNTITFNHKNTHGAIQTQPLTKESYVPCVYMRDDGSFALLNGIGINVHARFRDTVGDSVDKPTSAGCITVGDDATLKEYTEFVDAYNGGQYAIGPIEYNGATTLFFDPVDEYKDVAALIMDRYLAKDHLLKVYNNNREAIEFITAFSTACQADTDNLLGNSVFYPSFLDLSVKAGTAVRLIPSGSAEALGTAESLTATALYKLADGSFWYRVMFNGCTGYIPASSVTDTTAKYDDLSIHSTTWPTEKTYGNSFSVTGILGAVYNRYIALLADITDMDGNSESSASYAVKEGERPVSSYTLNGSDYAISYSDSIDYNLGFSGLALGEHKYQIIATVKNYFVRDGELCSEEKTVTMLDKQFTVVPPAITEGAESEWMQGSEEGLTFLTNINNNRLTGVRLDGEALASGYTANEASPVAVTLTAETLAGLDLGEHKLTVTGKYGDAEAVFYVLPEHPDGVHTGGEATCIHKAVCDICGREYGEPDMQVHKNTELRGKADATTEAEGYTGDLYCADCGTLLEQGEVIPKLVKPSDNPKTGDTTHVVLWVILLAVSGGVLASDELLRRKKERS